MPFTWQRGNSQERWRDWKTGSRRFMLPRADSDFTTFWCLFATQLQGLAGELREGLHAALTELSELRQRDNLEDKLQTHLTEVDDKIMGLKNSLNTLKVVDHTAISFNGSEAFTCKDTHKHSCWSFSVWGWEAPQCKHNLERLTGSCNKFCY